MTRTTLYDDTNLRTASRNERLFIALICLIAGIRVFIFSAAFPFFNNVDEQAHFDLVFKYSYGRLPVRPLEKYDPQAVKIIVDNGTTEYFNDFVDFLSPDEKKEIASIFETGNNRETWSWPSYYLLSGLWCRLGIWLGMTSGGLLYWVRFLNVFIIMAIVWISYRISALFFSDNLQCRMAAPIMAAFFPQDIFYSITSDVLSPLVFAVSFFMLLQIYLNDKSLRYHIFTGLVIAVTFLTKVSNIAILAMAAVTTFIKIKQNAAQKRLKNYLPSVAAIVLAVTIPVTFWLGRNYMLFDDVIGSTAVTQDRDWQVKPLSEMSDHPIFTVQGSFTFITELVNAFWRGEFIWRTQRLAVSMVDFFYVFSSIVFLTAAVIFFITKKTKLDRALCFVIPASLLVILISVLFLVFASMRYEFGEFHYPSNEHPYFTSGRLMAGTIVPFLILYVTGLNYILSKLRLSSRLLITVIIIISLITISEIIITLPVFETPYNWYHLK